MSFSWGQTKLSVISGCPYSVCRQTFYFVKRSSSARTKIPGGGGGGGGEVFNKVLYGEAPPRGSNPYTFIYHFREKRYAFRIPFVDNREL